MLQPVVLILTRSKKLARKKGKRKHTYWKQSPKKKKVIGKLENSYSTFNIVRQRRRLKYFISLLVEGKDGKLHLKGLMSPEFGCAEDTNYNFALIRWACRTLLELNKRYNLKDPLAPRWQEVLDRLAPYPTDENGYRIGSNRPVDRSHRHWSHLLMYHPLHIEDARLQANQVLLRKSLTHWLTVGGRTDTHGWSCSGAASLYASMGDGENALAYLHEDLNDTWRIQPNTMFIYPDGGPVLESSSIFNHTLNDMLLQSYGDTIRVFPAVPSAWKDAVFRNLRAEGAFLVSARRSKGKTEWVSITSLAGEPCVIAPGFDGNPKTTAPIKPLGQGRYELTLAKGDEALLYVGDRPGELIAEPLPMNPKERNHYGVKRTILSPVVDDSLGVSKTGTSGYKPKGCIQNPAKAFTNTLGMKFVSVPGTKVLFGVWDVRVQDYRAFADADSGVVDGWKHPGFQQNVNLPPYCQQQTDPVVKVSWNDANAFCKWLSHKEARQYRLPTDAEWSVAVGLDQEEGSTPKEKAFGFKNVYSWGSQWPPPKGAGNYGTSLNVDNYLFTSPVGSFAANKFGLYDMGGNVWQWCGDWYDGDQTSRVMRGASWTGNYHTPELPLSCRGRAAPDGRANDVGFRVVLDGGVTSEAK
jgi:formylglycine-generating enzyme required for sulfatase activity